MKDYKDQVNGWNVYLGNNVWDKIHPPTIPLTAVTKKNRIDFGTNVAKLLEEWREEAKKWCDDADL